MPCWKCINKLKSRNRSRQWIRSATLSGQFSFSDTAMSHIVPLLRLYFLVVPKNLAVEFRRRVAGCSLRGDGGLRIAEDPSVPTGGVEGPWRWVAAIAISLPLHHSDMSDALQKFDEITDNTCLSQRSPGRASPPVTAPLVLPKTAKPLPKYECGCSHAVLSEGSFVWRAPWLIGSPSLSS